MESEDTCDFENEQQFWEALEKTISQPCETHDLIDDALRSYLGLISTCRESYVQTDDELGHCAYTLYASALFTQHANYIRRQFVYCLLQEDEPDVLRLAATFLLADARENEATFDLLNSEGVFPRLVECVAHPKENEEGLHRLLMELMYEMARIQRVTNDNLTCVDDKFIRGLFDIIEQVSDDVNDPYHYPVIRVLLVLNEQFMVAAHDPAAPAQKTAALTNKVIKVLSAHGSRYKTFGENIILLLNREDETSLQLLTLKLMYLLFTTPPTYEYFYTNDLRVLVDVLVRNLLDLPEEAVALRHTYLRVLYPLLENTQLQHPPYYKRGEIKKLLSMLCGEHAAHFHDTDGGSPTWNHFEEVDETTKRLVRRCRTVSWLVEPEIGEMELVESPIDGTGSAPPSPISASKAPPPALPAPRKLKKRSTSQSATLSGSKYLRPHLESATQSSLSVMEMATQKEKPGVITPSRNPSLKHGLIQAIMAKKERPPPPQARRSAFRRPIGHHKVDSGEKLDENGSQREQSEKDELDEKADPSAEDYITTVKIDVDINTSEANKKPPPAPKTRRWRGKRAKEEDEGGGDIVVRSETPGKFNTSLPSINTGSAESKDKKFMEASPFSPPFGSVPEDSPFSPQVHKTLSPTSPFDQETTTALIAETKILPSTSTNPSSRYPPRVSSVSAALNRAQAQAIHDVEEIVERVNLQDHEHDILLPEHQKQRELQRRVVLAPPGPAPMRGVPGPRVELERSPFLSDEENSNGNNNGAGGDGGDGTEFLGDDENGEMEEEARGK